MGKKSGVSSEHPMLEQESGIERTIEASRSRALERPRADAAFSFQRGERLGRFLVLDKLGDGAMGLVFSAYDPDLDRKVAIKLLRAELSDDETATHGQQRLVREAQAMAKLSHPNVVTVFEVGTLSDRVFIAMEFVDGVTMSAWLEQEQRPWREVIAVFEQAGRGLAAAHAAGLVHRDFKPDNVLIPKSGAPTVADFGLASAAAQAVASDTPTLGSLRAALATRSLSMTLTRTGQLLGTPAYMAPEQFSGTKVDARADQFSFCVTLYEALFGTAPFEGASVVSLYGNIMSGRVKPPPASTKVPKWVFEALLRGLSAKPEDRFDSMDDLLVVLTRDPAEELRKRVLIGGVGFVLVMLLSIIAGAAYESRQERPCAGVEQEIDDVWNEGVRSAVKKAFTATGRRDAEDTFQRVDGTMTAYVAAWSVMRSQACEATFVRREQSEMLLDRRVRCLQRRKAEAGAVASLLSRTSDREILGNAVQVAAQLTPLDVCADTEVLLAVVPLPEDPATRAKVDGMRARLDQVAALHMANTKASYEEGSAIANEIERAAAELDYRPIQAEALRWKGDMQYGTGDLKGAEATFGRALLAAAEARDDRLQAIVLTRMLKLLSYDQGRSAEALAMFPVAEAATVRANDDRLRAQVVFGHAFMLYYAGKLDESQQEAERALAIATGALGEDNADVAETIDFIGVLLSRRGRFEEAVKQHERARDAMVRALGPRHNRVAEVLNNLCKAHKDAGQPERARPVCEQSMEIAIHALGPRFQGVGCTRAHYAEVLCALGEAERGAAEARSASELLQSTVGREHRWTVAADVALGLCLLAAGQSKAAIEPLEHARECYEKQGGRALELAKTRFALARALWDSGGDKVRARTLASLAEQAYASEPGVPKVELQTIRSWIAEHDA